MSPMVRLPLTIEQALLGFLRPRPMHGYEIHQQLSEAAGLGRVWQLKQSQLYALLARLEETGWVTATVEPQETRPPRRVYHLTPAGDVAFQNWVSSPVEHGRQFRLEFLAKLYFAQREGPAVVDRLLDQQTRACRSWLAEQEAQAETLAAHQPYDWLVCQFRIGQIRAMLDWLETCHTTILSRSPLK